MRKTLVAIFLLFSFIIQSQTIKVDLDSVIIYCSHTQLIKAIKKLNKTKSQSVNETFATVAESDLSWLLHIKKSNDTIEFSSNIWLGDLVHESKWLMENNKLTFFDKRNNKLVKHISKTTIGIEGRVLFNLYYDTETKNKLYQTVKKNWMKF